MQHNIEQIKDLTLLNSLSDEVITSNIKNKKFKLTSYKKNSIIHFDGERCTKLEIILSGKVVIDSIDEDGNLLTISNFYNNDILGGNLVFSRNPYYPMTISAQLASDILEIEKDVLFDLFGDNPNFLYTYLELISDNAFILSEKIKHYINKTLREKIMSYLDYKSKNQNSDHIKLRITKKALAEKLGVARTSLSRELAKMRDEGIITFDRDSITLLG
ncbi:MAG: Crp/Fnr family transcriptional regulator [Anaerolineaceae bacterium]|nr:MAG: Crp/Fnr family transcriptional regulator [Anaerolineaceae bacterium]